MQPIQAAYNAPPSGIPHCFFLPVQRMMTSFKESTFRQLIRSPEVRNEKNPGHRGNYRRRFDPWQNQSPMARGVKTWNAMT